jgi:hypothetical protein
MAWKRLARMRQQRKSYGSWICFCSSTYIQKNRRRTMKRVLLCAALLALVSVTLVAQTVPGAIPINGGRDTVALHSQQSTKPWNAPGGTPFYSNLTSAYQCGIGQTLSDGSPVNTEFTQGGGFISAKTGTTKSITVAIGFVTGTNAAIMTLVKDCNGVPCRSPDGGTELCSGFIKNLPAFGTSCTVTTTFHCKANLKQGKSYWLNAQTLANSWDAWNWNGAGATGSSLSQDDGAWSTNAGTQGAFSVQ